MKFDIGYSDVWEGFFVSWGPDDTGQEDKIKQWCNETFKNNWHDGIDDFNYLVLPTEKDAVLFSLKWS
jgi:hypothetical protein